MTQTFSIVLTDEQSAKLFIWGTNNGVTSKSDILRALLHVALPDLPPDPPPHGGNRGFRPDKHTTVVLTEDWGKHRAGTCGVVEARRRTGALVAFGSESIVVPYRYLNTDTEPLAF